MGRGEVALGHGARAAVQAAHSRCRVRLGWRRLHCSLALNQLVGELYPTLLCRDASAAYDQVHDTLQRVLQMYIFHLIDTGAPCTDLGGSAKARLVGRQASDIHHSMAHFNCSCKCFLSAHLLPTSLPHPPTGAHKLVPLYACHLRAGLRHTTYQIFFEQLLAQVGGKGCLWVAYELAVGLAWHCVAVPAGQLPTPSVPLALSQQGTMEECRAAYRVADEWFSFWRHGDVVPVRVPQHLGCSCWANAELARLAVCP